MYTVFTQIEVCRFSVFGNNKFENMCTQLNYVKRANRAERNTTKQYLPTISTLFPTSLCNIQLGHHHIGYPTIVIRWPSVAALTIKTNSSSTRSSN